MLRVLCLLLSALAALPAVDLPAGVVAFVLPDSRDLGSCGGSAAIIAADGTAITLIEALPAGTADGAVVSVICIGGQRRRATVLRRDPASSAVLLRVADMPDSCVPLAIADPAGLRLGDPLRWCGNAAAAAELDGCTAVGACALSGRELVPDDEPPVHGRGGRVLSGYRGPALELAALVNDGVEGGAVCDPQGRLVALASRAQVRERRLGLAIPIDRLLVGLGLPPPATAAASDGAWESAASSTAGSLALVYLIRPQGPGNPEAATARPPRAVDAAPISERERLRSWWETYRHEQQILFTDQPVSALAIDAVHLLTAAGNLHGGAKRGVLVGPAGEGPACELVASDLGRDLALLRCERPHGLPPAQIASEPPPLGAEVALLGRHRAGPGFTLCPGIVSMVGRRRAQSVDTFLQLDARGNYGSLGGPVIDRSGRVVGLAVAMGPSYAWLINSGVTLAVDARDLALALPPLIAGTGRQQPPTLGMGVQLDYGQGADPVVVRVVPGTGAEAAGIVAQDVILSVDGRRSTSHTAIARALLRHRAGDRVPVVVRRGEAEVTLVVEIREF